MTQTTIDPAEATHFGKLAADWWDPKGSSAMLHALNPVRLRWVREQIDGHWGCDSAGFRPLIGKSAIDVGCGAGLMAEPLARMGAAVTGVDSAPENVAAARDHAAGMGLSIRYHAGEVANVAGQFDLVTAMEVIEHVTDPAAFVAALRARLAPGGLMILSTPNRTALSQFGMVMVAERMGLVPAGTHDWDKFITPDALEALLRAEGLKPIATHGIAWSVAKGLHLSDDLRMNYLMAAVAA